MDAKRPSENIFEGKNVFQAYSYAMHPEIQSEIYCLCNGKNIIVFNIKEHLPILSFEIHKLKENWKALKDILSPELVMKPHLKDFHLDFGLFLFKIGDYESKILPITFPLKKISDISKLNEDMYCINSIFGVKGFEGKTFMGTFDFSKKQYLELLKLLPTDFSNTIMTSLKNQPFRFMEEDKDLPNVNLNVKAIIGRTIHTNDNESYLPFIVSNFEK